jgi:hypothetical protein
MNYRRANGFRRSARGFCDLTAAGQFLTQGGRTITQTERLAFAGSYRFQTRPRIFLFDRRHIEMCRSQIACRTAEVKLISTGEMLRMARFTTSQAFGSGWSTARPLLVATARAQGGL